jgi:hypothetical protein
MDSISGAGDFTPGDPVLSAALLDSAVDEDFTPELHPTIEVAMKSVASISERDIIVPPAA